MRRAFLLLGLFAASLRGDAVAEMPFGRVYSSLDAATTSSIAVWLEAVEARYRDAGYPRRDPQPPVRAIVLGHALELAPYLGPGYNPVRNPGLSIAGVDHHDILVGWGPNGDPYRTLAHELAHLVDPSTERPLWFREGFAEYLARLDAPSHKPDAALLQGAWIPLADLLRARRGGSTATLPGFYSECRLVVDWMVRQGVPVSRLRPHELERLIAERGPAAVEAGVRELAHALEAEPRLPPVEPPPPTAYVRPAEPWEQATALADVERSIGRIQQAEKRLRELEAAYPEAPAVQAALGALAFDRRRYAEAERRLRIAARDPDADPRTLHRLALMLLRPVEDPAPDREAEAVASARVAAEARPDDPMFRLTLAQALTAAGRWEAAAGELEWLAATPGWRKQALEEYEELRRRRTQAMWSVEAPRIAPRAAWTPPDELFARILPEEIPQPPEDPPIRQWPPPGTAMVTGKIQIVECSSQGKVIVMASRLFSMRFREPKGRPARLLSPPLDWGEIPCGTYGWYVSLAYKPMRDENVRGEVVAILF